MAKVKNTYLKESRPRGGAEPPVNKYYMGVSRRFTVAKYLSVVLLVLFLAFMMIRFGDEITYANMMYLLRDFDTGDSSKISEFTSVEYDEQENMSYSMYRGELCVIGNRTLKMYNVRGEETRSYEPGYSDPALLSSDKYLLAYNVGSPDYSVFTSIARVHNGEAVGDIIAADINNRGDHLLVCRSKDTKYVVCTFDSSFRDIANYHKSMYVTSAAIGDDGRVVIVSFDSTGVGYESSVEMYLDGSESPDSTYTASGIFPVKCGVFKNGEFYVICTDRVLFFDKDGNLKRSTETVSEYTAYAVSNGKLAISYKNDSLGLSSSVIVFGAGGEVMYNKTVEGSVSSLALREDTVTALAGDLVYSIAADSIQSTRTEAGGSVVLSDKVSSVICFKNGASGIRYGDDTSAENSAVTE